MILVHRPLETGRSGSVPLNVSREMLAKTRWRCAAIDGTEFGFDLEEPLRDGSLVYASGDHVYVIRQMPEALLEVRIGDTWEAVRLGWMLGNLHFAIEITGDVIRVTDDVAVRQMLEREEINFGVVNAVFKPLSGGGHRHHRQ
jgi:urease accessory protein UreE